MPVKKAVRKTATPAFRGGKVGSVEKLKESLARSANAGMVWSVGDGQTAVVRFLTEPDEWSEYWQHFDSTAKQFFTCVGRDNGCEYCEEGDKASCRHLANVVDKADQRVRALVMPNTVVDLIIKKYDKWHTVLDRDYEISREGTGLNNTKYYVDWVEPKRMNLDRFELLDLDAIIASSVPGASSKPEDAYNEEDEAEIRGKRRRRPTIEDEEEEEEAPPPRRAVKKAMKAVKKAGKPPARRFR